MRYPNSLPIGRHVVGASETWRRAGDDLVVATQVGLVALQSAQGAERSLAMLELAEVRRRSGAPAECGTLVAQALRLRPDDPATLARARFTVAYMRWWTPGAARNYEAVRLLGERTETPLTQGVGWLGLARCSRFTSTGMRPDHIGRARVLFADDEDAHADADREEAAHALLAGDNERAQIGRAHV